MDQNFGSSLATTYKTQIAELSSLGLVEDRGRFIMFSVITNIYNNKNKGPTLIGLFTATVKLKKIFFWN
jgi:hypothetical protein